jgi:hypothetical protein
MRGKWMSDWTSAGEHAAIGRAAKSHRFYLLRVLCHHGLGNHNSATYLPNLKGPDYATQIDK